MKKSQTLNPGTYKISDIIDFLNKLVNNLISRLYLLCLFQGQIDGNQIIAFSSINNAHPFKDEFSIEKLNPNPVGIRLSRQIAYQLGFVSFVQIMESNFDIVSIKIQNDFTKISANLVTHFSNLKLK